MARRWLPESETGQPDGGRGGDGPQVTLGLNFPLPVPACWCHWQQAVRSFATLSMKGASGATGPAGGPLCVKDSDLQVVKLTFDSESRSRVLEPGTGS